MACDARLPARFLAGDLDGTAGDRFEDHLVDCDDCWQAVTDARAGRALAEGLREAAPPGMRDRIRLISVAGPLPSPVCGRRPRRWRPTAAAGVAAAIVVVAVAAALVFGPGTGDPSNVAWVVRRAAQTQNSPGSGSFTVQDVDGDALLVKVTSERGVPVVVALGRAPFAMIAGSNRLPLAGAEAWAATRHGLSVVCVNEPIAALAVGAVTPERLAALAAAAQSDPVAQRLLSVAPP